MNGNKRQLPRRPIAFNELDRTAVRVFDSFEEADRYDRDFWWARTPDERMQALEHIRQLAWGYTDAEPKSRFPRTVRVVELDGS